MYSARQRNPAAPSSSEGDYVNPALGEEAIRDDDAMSLELKSIHLRLDPEVKSRVDVLAEAAGQDCGRALPGDGHRAGDGSLACTEGIV